jgi:hypothetical protein
MCVDLFLECVFWLLYLYFQGYVNKIFCVAKEDLKIMIFLPQPPKSWNYKPVKEAKLKYSLDNFNTTFWNVTSAQQNFFFKMFQFLLILDLNSF